MPDAGNPNFFTTYKGRYTMTPAANVSLESNALMLTCTNFVQFTGDFVLQADFGAGVTIATLPEEVVPVDGAYLSAVHDAKLTLLVVDDAGEISTTEALSAGTVTPLCYNIAGNFYKQEVQNG